MANEEVEAKARDAWWRLSREERLRSLRFGPKAPKPLDTKRKLPKQAVPAVSITTPAEVEGYIAAFAAVFRYRQTRERALLYLLGLLSDLGRKNGETMEAGIPGVTQQGVWDFLVRSPWSAEALDQARVEHYLSTCGVRDRAVDIVIDEVSLLKQGKRSIGVARQYLGCVGKTANGQVAVTLHGVVEPYDLPLCGRLYLPEGWAGDKDGRESARVPDTIAFQTKPDIAWQLLGDVRRWGLTLGRIYGDPAYGDLGLMRRLDAASLPYCLGVKSTFTVRLPQEPRPAPPEVPPYSGMGRPRKAPRADRQLHAARELRTALPPEAWHAVPYRLGVDGSVLTKEFAALWVSPATKDQDGIDLWLLFERPPGDPASVNTKQYVITGPRTASVDELAQLAHRRPIIERYSYENAKQEAGLDQYQGRSWPGFHHHLAMVWLALTWLHLHRRHLPSPPTPATPAPTEAAHAPSTRPRPDQPSQPCLALPTGATVPVLLAARAPIPLPLPRQVWESVQAVRRRLIAWFRAVTHLELSSAPCRPPLPDLCPLPLGP